MDLSDPVDIFYSLLEWWGSVNPLARLSAYDPVSKTDNFFKTRLYMLHNIQYDMENSHSHRKLVTEKEGRS